MVEQNSINNGARLTQILQRNKIPAILAGPKIQLVSGTEIYSPMEIGMEVFLDGHLVGALDETLSGNIGFYRTNREDIVKMMDGASFPSDYEFRFRD